MFKIQLYGLPCFEVKWFVFHTISLTQLIGQRRFKAMGESNAFYSIPCTAIVLLSAGMGSMARGELKEVHQRMCWFTSRPSSWLPEDDKDRPQAKKYIKCRCFCSSFFIRDLLERRGRGREKNLTTAKPVSHGDRVAASQRLTGSVQWEPSC